MSPPPPVPPPSQPPPAPSQAGRFKPRAKKPAKKIRVGEASGLAGDGGGGGATPAAASAAAGRGGGRGGRGRGQRGGGRGAAGGRGGATGGRAGAAVAQGEAFFQAPPSAGARKATGSSGRSSVGRDVASGVGARGSGGRGLPQQAEAQEEIVGILDEGVGAAAAAIAKASLEAKSKSQGSKSDLSDDPEKEGAVSPRAAARRAKQVVDAAASGPYYDDDSSSDDDEPSSGPASELLQPIVLPEPPPRSSAPRPATVTSAGASRPLEGDASPLLALVSELLRGAHNDLSLSHPPASAEQQHQQQSSDGEWLLVQLPTRLPPLQRSAENPGPPPETVSSSQTAYPVPSGDDPRSWHQPTAAAAVSLPSVRSDRFDDALRGSASGRLGKLVLYKSGKARLVLEGPGGEETVRMDVTARNCGLFQQAVAIDAEARKLVVLGSVRQSVVATPELPPE